LWDLFSAPERIEKDLELVRRVVRKYEEEFGSDFNAVLKIEERVDDIKNQGRLLQPVTAPTIKKTKKPRNVLGLDEAMDEGEEVEEEEEEEEGALDEEVDDEDLLVKKKQLDLMVEYLRRVFNFCFFCVFESDSIHELTRKCPGGHLRRPRNTLSSAGKAAARASALGEPFPGKKRNDQSEDTDMMGGLSPEAERKVQRSNTTSKSEQQLQRAFNWVKTFEEKVMLILEPGSIEVQKLGGKPTEEALQEELVKYVKQEDEHKFRCRVPECQKLFKEEHFWRKHVEKRHPDWLEGLRKDVSTLHLVWTITRLKQNSLTLSIPMSWTRHILHRQGRMLIAMAIFLLGMVTCPLVLLAVSTFKRLEGWPACLLCQVLVLLVASPLSSPATLFNLR
jgi:uncharacterized C2H2 Zn-finger protein